MGHRRGRSFRISIHALRGEGDDRPPKNRKRLENFNPRPPWGGRPSYPPLFTQNLGFQSTPSVGRATCTAENCDACANISIHALRGEGDQNAAFAAIASHRFQSTPSVGRATEISPPPLDNNIDFNPRPPWGGRLYALKAYNSKCKISIHALRGEGDCDRLHRFERAFQFQSTPSVGRATFSEALLLFLHGDFNPRPPWGGRQIRTNGRAHRPKFQSTPSVGRATRISITTA